MDDHTEIHFDLRELEASIKAVKGVGEKRAEEIMGIVEHWRRLLWSLLFYLPKNPRLMKMPAISDTSTMYMLGESRLKIRY